jgi:hypothetical protein
VADGETVALGEDFSDTPTMADVPISLIAQETARRRPCEFGGLLQRELGFGAGEPLLDDRPKPVPFAAAVGEAAFGGVPSARRWKYRIPASSTPAASCRLEKPGRRDIGRSRTSSKIATPAVVRVARTSFSSAFS